MIAGLVACGADKAAAPMVKPLPTETTVAVDFRTNAAQYTMASSGATTFVNKSTKTFVLGACEDVFERFDGTTWVEVPPLNLACPAIAILLSPGDSVTRGMDFRPISAAGTYRQRRQFSVQSDTIQSFKRTNSFVVVR